MPEIPFADLAEVNPRRPLSRGERYPFVEMAAVPEGGGRPAHHEEREFNGSGSKFASGDTLFARITPCTENGKLAFVESLPSGTVGFGSTELIVLAAQAGKADPRFVYQYVASEPVRRQAVARMLGTSGRQRVPAWFFSEELTVPEFSLPEQRAIAAVLDSIDEAIERTDEVIAATERLRDALLHELLTSGLPGHHTAWRDVPGLGTIPADWEVARLGDVTTGMVYGPRFPADWYASDGNVVTLRTTDISESGAIDWSDAPAADLDTERFAQFLLHSGDIVVTRSGTCGIAAIFRGHQRPVLPGAFLIRMVAVQVEPDWVGLFLNSSTGRAQTRRAQSGGVQKNLNAPSLRSVLLPVPPAAERQAIVGTLDSLDTAIEGARSERAALQSSKASTADALLTGRVRVDPGRESTTACR